MYLMVRIYQNHHLATEEADHSVMDEGATWAGRKQPEASFSFDFLSSGASSLLLPPTFQPSAFSLFPSLTLSVFCSYPCFWDEPSQYLAPVPSNLFRSTFSTMVFLISF